MKSPQKGTYDGGVYGGSSASSIELNTIRNGELQKIISTPVLGPVSALAWAPTTKSDPLGVIVGGHGEGKMVVYSPTAMLSGNLAKI